MQLLAMKSHLNLVQLDGYKYYMTQKNKNKKVLKNRMFNAMYTEPSREVSSWRITLGTLTSLAMPIVQHKWWTKRTQIYHCIMIAKQCFKNFKNIILGYLYEQL